MRVILPSTAGCAWMARVWGMSTMVFWESWSSAARCSVTLPVAVISKDGQVLRGTTTASLSGGTFQATQAADGIRR